MKVQLSATGDVNVLTVTGEFTSELVSKFQQAASEAFASGRRDVLVDLTGTKLLDSAALEALTALQRQTEEQLGMLRLCVGEPALRKVFDITRLSAQLIVLPTREEALAQFTGAFAGVAGGAA